MENENFQSHSQCLGKREGLEIVLINKGRWFDQSCPSNETSIQTCKQEFGKLRGWWAHQGVRWAAHMERAWKFPALTPMPHPMHLLLLGVPKLHSLYKTSDGSWRLFPSSVSHSSKLLNLRWELWEPSQVIANWSEVLVATWNFSVDIWRKGSFGRLSS